jgi:hypothetical protein
MDDCPGWIAKEDVLLGHYNITLQIEVMRIL